MASDVVTRLRGVKSSQAIKVPCKVATTANITLSGEQTIDGVAVVGAVGSTAADRVLVKDQTTASENGIYDVSTGAWRRTADWDGIGDIVSGTTVYVTSGTAGAGRYKVTTTGTIVVGTTSVTIVGDVLYQANGALRYGAGGFYSDFGAIVHRLNDRVFVGAAADNDGKFTAPTEDWLETLIANTTGIAQFASIARINGFGVLGAVRTSDSVGNLFSAGVAGFAINDETVLDTVTCAFYGEARHMATAFSKTTLQENDIVTETGTSIGTMTPYAMIAGLVSANLWLSNGRPDVSSGDATVAIGILNNTAAPTTSGRYLRGIVFGSDSIYGTDGATGEGTAIAMGLGHLLSWYMTGVASPKAQISSSINSSGLAEQRLQFTNGGPILGSLVPNVTEVVQLYNPLLIPVGTAQIAKYAADATGSLLYFSKSRHATIGSHTVAQLDDVLGGFIAQGNTGSAFSDSAAIVAYANGLHSGSSTPGRIDFFVTPGSTTALVRKLSLLPSGFKAFTDVISEKYSADANGWAHYFRKSRNATELSHTIVVDDDTLGSLLFQGSDGSAFQSGAAIAAYVDGTPGASDMPGRLELLTTPDGSATLVTRVSVLQDGTVQFASPSFTANGSVATTMTSLGPAGANTTVREWLTIRNAAGSVRYIPTY